MSMEQFESEMALAGYNEEQIAEAKRKLQEWAQQCATTIQELMEQLREVLVAAFSRVKEAFVELSEMGKEVLDERSPSKYTKPSKRLAYVNVNNVTNQVVKSYSKRDVRSMNMNFTRHRQKR